MDSCSSSHECPICYEAIEVTTTGRVEMSCRHAFHFKCLTTWFSSQEKGTCPMCRKEASELEDFGAAVSEDEDDDDEDDEDDEDEELLDPQGGGFIRVARDSMNTLITVQGGNNLVIIEEDDAPTFDDHDYAIICRMEFEYIIGLHGGRAFTDEQWATIMADFPVPPAPEPTLREVGLESFAEVAAAAAEARILTEVKRVILNPEEEDDALEPEVTL
jgi:hypothetical protein